MRTFQMHLLEADKVFFEGECESLVVPTTVGQYGILAGHSNMISRRRAGRALLPAHRVRSGAPLPFRGHGEGRRRQRYPCACRLRRVPEEIDAKRAQRAADEAKEAILKSAACANTAPRRRTLPAPSTACASRKKREIRRQNHTEFPNMQKAFRAFGALFAYFKKVCFFHELSKFRKNYGTKRRNVL